MKTIFLIVGLITGLISCTNELGDFNTSPIADFTYSPQNNIDTSTYVIFDDTNSYDAESILKYQWSFEKKNEWTVASYNTHYAYKFGSIGEFNIGLKVTDNKGWNTTIRKKINILK
jgi:hypothetical protein